VGGLAEVLVALATLQGTPPNFAAYLPPQVEGNLQREAMVEPGFDTGGEQCHGGGVGVAALLEIAGELNDEQGGWLSGIVGSADRWLAMH